ncbi:MAG TPA: effector binding domain-containing protein [Clostridia bacterium]|nr:effector binding domain-containing protein [Clostridia bacterium]
MNYYESIQRSINYIESRLGEEIDPGNAAREAIMSLSNFYRMFFALAGYTVKEYVRLRRISLAAGELSSDNCCIVDLAVKYGFDSADAFSRAFRRITGYLPSEFRKNSKKYNFERIDIMDKYFEVQDRELLEKYPDIKVLKKVEPIRVAYYCYFGKDPETNAFSVVADWLNKSGIKPDDSNFRVFGYNNPSPSSPDQTEYGYEVCVTIGDGVEVNDEKVKAKMLEGGLYAVTGVRRNRNGELGEEIMKTWQRLNNWLVDSKYVYGGHQWLEEHLGFDDEFRHTGGIDLYMPIAERNVADFEKTFETEDPMWTAAYTATGKDAGDRARNYLIKWADENGLFVDGKQHRYFAYYNHLRIGYDDFFFKMCVTVDKDFNTGDPAIVTEEFKGGQYAVMKSKFKYNGMAWSEFIKWTSKNKDYTFGDHWFFEEYSLDRPEVNMETDMMLHMSIKPRK